MPLQKKAFLHLGRAQVLPDHVGGQHEHLEEGKIKNRLDFVVLREPLCPDGSFGWQPGSQFFSQ